MPSRIQMLQAALRSLRDEALRKGEMEKAIAPPISARIQALGEQTGHTQPAYRGLEGVYDDRVAMLRGTLDQPQWHSRAPELASGYASERDVGTVLPEMLRLGNNLETDADFAPWTRLSLNALPDREVARQVRKAGFATDTLDDSYTDTQSLAKIARLLGYDSVTIRNLRYPRQRGEMFGGGVDDVFATFPSENIRAQWAKFDPKKKNETGILLGVGGLAGAAGLREALRDRQQAGVNGYA